MVWRHGALFRFEDVPKIRGKACSDVYSDRRGRQWVGFAGGGIAVHSDASTELYTEADGLAGGGVLAILEDRSGDIWVTTRSGVSRFHNGRFTTLTEANGPFIDLIAALVEGDDGYVWVGVNGGAAIVRFLASEMDKVARQRIAADRIHLVRRLRRHAGQDSVAADTGRRRSRP